MAAVIRALRRLFAPHGSLLTTDIICDVTIHLLANGQAKTMVGKFQDTPNQDVAQMLIQTLLNSAIGVAKERHISIHWPAVAKMHPPYPEHK